MAAILSKEARLNYIKEAAARLREEKRRDQIIAQTETEFAEALDVEPDPTLVEEFYGIVATGIEKINGGIRHLPVFIL